MFVYGLIYLTLPMVCVGLYEASPSGRGARRAERSVNLFSEFIFYYKLVPTRSSHLGFYFATYERQSKQSALLCRKDTFPTGRLRKLGEDRR